MRISRPCYDKPHRCPGWAGGGLKNAAEERCDGGRIEVESRLEECILVAVGEFNPHPGAHPTRFGHCTTCDVVTLPWATRLIDPTWHAARARHAARRLRWRWQDLRAGR